MQFAIMEQRYRYKFHNPPTGYNRPTFIMGYMYVRQIPKLLLQNKLLQLFHKHLILDIFMPWTVLLPGRSISVLETLMYITIIRYIKIKSFFPVLVYSFALYIWSIYFTCHLFTDIQNMKHEIRIELITLTSFLWCAYASPFSEHTEI